MIFRHRWSYKKILIGLILSALTLVIFWQTTGFGFTNYDDDKYVRDNPYVRAGLNSPSIKWAFTAAYEGTWQPLVWLSYMLDRQVQGHEPGGYHRTNVLFHILNSVLLFVALNRMTASVWRSSFVAALFAVHPLHVESVAWIAERKDVLSGFFWMVTMLAYVEYVRRPSLERYVWIVLAFILGLMCKPMLVTLPIALLLLDYWPLGRVVASGEVRSWLGIWLNLVREKLPLFALALASSVVAYVVQQERGALSSLEQIPVGLRVSNALVSYIKYIAKMIWPTSLAVIYPHPGNTLPDWQVVVSAALLLSISALVFMSARRHPYLAVGWLWYLVTLVPVIGLIQVGAHAMADRFTYIPLIGLFVGGVWWISGVVESKPSFQTRTIKATSAVLAVAIISLLVGRSYSQASYWSDSITLFKHAIAVTSGNHVAYNQLGAAYREAGNLDEAIACFKKAMSINSRYRNTHGNLAKALVDVGRIDEAVPIYLGMLSANPEDVRTRVNLAGALAQQGKMDEAVHQFELAVATAPDYILGRRGLGKGYLSQKRYPEAIQQYLEIIQIDPTDVAAHTNLAVAYYYIQDYHGAWAEVRKCRSLGADVSPVFVKALSTKVPDQEP